MSYKSIYNLIGFKEEIKRLQRQANLGFDKEFRTLKWLGLKDGMKILDVGSGPGFYTELLLENLPSSQITALEIDPKLMEIGKNNLEKYGDRVDFKETSINSSSIEDNTYDFVIARFVFQHMENPIAAAKEIYRILKPGGIVAIIDSDKGMWGICEPENIMSGEKNILSKIEKSARWNREIGRRLVKILKFSGFEELDFEAVTIHSDIVGINKILGETFLNKQDFINIMNRNPKLAKMLKMNADFGQTKKSTMILINLIAKGVKDK